MIAVVIGLIYVGFYFVLLNITNPKGNRWTVLEFIIILGASLVSIGSIYFSFLLSGYYFHKLSLGYRYAIMLLMSIPIFCAMFLPYWVLLVRQLIYGNPTDQSAYPGQLVAITTGLHLPIVIITISSLYNAHVHRVKMQLANVQNLVIETQLKNLQQQVDPHFLFNSLNILSALIKQDPEKSFLFTQKLAEVYRFLLKSQKRGINFSGRRAVICKRLFLFD